MSLTHLFEAGGLESHTLGDTTDTWSITILYPESLAVHAYNCQIKIHQFFLHMYICIITNLWLVYFRVKVVVLIHANIYYLFSTSKMN